MPLIEVPAEMARERPNLREEVGRLVALERTLRALPVLVQRPEDLWKALLDMARTILPWRGGSLMLAGPDGLVVVAYFGEPPDFDSLDLGYRLRIGEGFAGYAAERRTIVYQSRAPQHPRYAKGHKTAFNTIVCCPLVVGDDCVGVINLHDVRNLQPPDEVQTSQLALVAAVGGPSLYVAEARRLDASAGGGMPEPSAIDAA